MMLKGWVGSIFTGAGLAPAGASQSAQAPAPSMIRRALILSLMPSNSAATDASGKKSLAPQSSIIAARLSAVADGARGAVTTPSRSALRTVAASSIEVVEHVGIASQAEKH